MLEGCQGLASASRGPAVLQLHQSTSKGSDMPHLSNTHLSTLEKVWNAAWINCEFMFVDQILTKILKDL